MNEEMSDNVQDIPLWLDGLDEFQITLLTQTITNWISDLMIQAEEQ